MEVLCLCHATRRGLMAVALIDRVDLFARVIAGMRVKARAGTTLPTLPVKTRRRNLPPSISTFGAPRPRGQLPASSWSQRRLYDRSILYGCYSFGCIAVKNCTDMTLTGSDRIYRDRFAVHGVFKWPSLTVEQSGLCLICHAYELLLLFVEFEGMARSNKYYDIYIYTPLSFVSSLSFFPITWTLNKSTNSYHRLTSRLNDRLNETIQAQFGSNKVGDSGLRGSFKGVTRELRVDSARINSIETSPWLVGPPRRRMCVPRPAIERPNPPPPCKRGRGISPSLSSPFTRRKTSRPPAGRRRGNAFHRKVATTQDARTRTISFPPSPRRRHPNSNETLPLPLHPSFFLLLSISVEGLASREHVARVQFAFSWPTTDRRRFLQLLLCPASV